MKLRMQYCFQRYQVLLGKRKLSVRKDNLLVENSVILMTLCLDIFQDVRRDNLSRFSNSCPTLQGPDSEELPAINLNEGNISHQEHQMDIMSDPPSHNN